MVTSTAVDEEIQQLEVIQSESNVCPTITIIRVAEAEQPKSTRRSCTPFRISCALVLVCAIIAGTVSGVFTNLKETAANSDFDLFDPSTWHIDINPHGDGRDTPFDFNTWESVGCKGLELHVIDNLEEKWQPYFKRAIEDWDNDNGEPDVLTLHVRKPTFFDPGCEPSEGLLKVCNGDFGDTDWIGINQVVISYGIIASSVAIMNDWHLDKMSDAAKQNTMCHEIGHGLGLGHWDENFYNRDLGNCMDYTNNHEVNQHPDVSNFIFLEQMYGNVAGTSRYSEYESDTEGLYCTSSNTEEANIGKQRRLGSDAFSEIATLLSTNPTLDGLSRQLERDEHKDVWVLDFDDGVKVVSTFHRL